MAEPIKGHGVLVEDILDAWFLSEDEAYDYAEGCEIEGATPDIMRIEPTTILIVE